MTLAPILWCERTKCARHKYMARTRTKRERLATRTYETDGRAQPRRADTETPDHLVRPRTGARTLARLDPNPILDMDDSNALILDHSHRLDS